MHSTSGTFALHHGIQGFWEPSVQIAYTDRCFYSYISCRCFQVQVHVYWVYYSPWAYHFVLHHFPSPRGPWRNAWRQEPSEVLWKNLWNFFHKYRNTLNLYILYLCIAYHCILSMLQHMLVLCSAEVEPKITWLDHSGSIFSSARSWNSIVWGVSRQNGSKQRSGLEKGSAGGRLHAAEISFFTVTILTFIVRGSEVKSFVYWKYVYTCLY